MYHTAPTRSNFEADFTGQQKLPKAKRAAQNSPKQNRQTGPGYWLPIWAGVVIKMAPLKKRKTGLENARWQKYGFTWIMGKVKT